MRFMYACLVGCTCSRTCLSAVVVPVRMPTQAGYLMEPLAAEVNASTALTTSSHHVSACILHIAGAGAAMGRATGMATGSGGKRHHSVDAQLDELGACRSKLRAVVGDDPLHDVAGDAAEVLGKGVPPCAMQLSAACV